MIPYLDLASRDVELGPAADAAIATVLRSGEYVGGSAVSRFEQNFADYIGTQYCVGVGNGLDALSLLLQALGVGAGDEVIVPAQTFVATWLAVAETGATPIPVDIETGTGNISADAVSLAITPRTVGVIAVHLHGVPADMIVLGAICARHNLFLLEDAAQAHGARTREGMIGSLGHAAAFSFYPTKNLGAIGDAGAVVTRDRQVAERVRQIANYGGAPSQRKSLDLRSRNSRLDPIQAAFLDLTLPRLEGWNSIRTEIADVYTGSIQGSEHLAPLLTPAIAAHSVWHHYVVLSTNRDRLKSQLLGAGIQSQIHYQELPLEFSYFSNKSRWHFSDFPNAFRHSRSVLSLPLHPWLGNKALDVAATLSRLSETHD